MTRHVLIPLPDRDFDVTEVAVPWRLLTLAGYRVTFATARGGMGPPAAADPLLLGGVLSGLLWGKLGADPEPKDFYRQMEHAPAFREPVSWNGLDAGAFDGLILPGGHAPGMRQYLEDEALREKVATFFTLDRPVGAICHGVLVLARTRDPRTGKSVLHSRRTTCLPRYMERSAYLLTFWKLGRYYRTYPAYVEDEVKAALSDPARQFHRGPRVLTARGTAVDDGPAFVVEDGNYVSARWPGDAYLFTRRFQALVEQAGVAGVAGGRGT